MDTLVWKSVNDESMTKGRRKQKVKNTLEKVKNENDVIRTEWMKLFQAENFREILESFVVEIMFYDESKVGVCFTLPHKFQTLNFSLKILIGKPPRREKENAWENFLSPQAFPWRGVLWVNFPSRT